MTAKQIRRTQQQMNQIKNTRPFIVLRDRSILRQVVADAQHSEQLATLSRRRSDVRMSTLEDGGVWCRTGLGVLFGNTTPAGAPAMGAEFEANQVLTA